LNSPDIFDVFQLTLLPDQAKIVGTARLEEEEEEEEEEVIPLIVASQFSI